MSARPPSAARSTITCDTGRSAAVYDSQWPPATSGSSPRRAVIDLQSIDDQMRVFDRLTGVTLIDVKGGLFTEVLDSLGRTGLLDDVRAGRFNLALLHVLGPSASSLSEMAISEKLGAGAKHLLVKNYVNEGGFKSGRGSAFRRLPGQPRRQRRHDPASRARACTEVQRLGMAFGSFIETSGVPHPGRLCPRLAARCVRCIHCRRRAGPNRTDRDSAVPEMKLDLILARMVPAGRLWACRGG